MFILLSVLFQLEQELKRKNSVMSMLRDPNALKQQSYVYYVIFLHKNLVGTRRQNDIVWTSFSRFDVVLTSIRRCFDVVCRLGLEWNY